LISLSEFDNSQFTILVVDDTEANRTIVSGLLKHSGFQVLLAENGRLALDIVRVVLPDLILLDVMMPELDGFETCRRLKENEATHDTPVIFMTALSATEDKLKGFNVGAVDYITRPLSQRELVARITTHLKNKILAQNLKQHAQFMETMNEIGRALTNTLDLREVLNLILDELRLIVAYDRAAVLIYQDQALEFVAARGFPSDTGLLYSTISLSDDSNDVFHQIFHTKRPLIISNPSSYPGWLEQSLAQTPAAWLGLPLIHQDNVIGILCLARDSTATFASYQINMAAAFASQAALALKNARLYDQLAQFNMQLEKQVQTRTQDLQEAYQQLERLDKTKADFIHVASHELFTPIALINGYCHILMSDDDLMTQPSWAQMIEGINKGARRLYEIVENMLDVAKIDNNQLNLYFQPLLIGPVFYQIRQSLETALLERNITLLIHRSISKMGLIEADPEALPKAFHQLIINAIKYTPDGGAIIVRGDAPTTNTVQIRIQDNGIGIDPAHHELVFTKFYQTGEVKLHSTGKTKFRGGGSGLGLAIVKGIIEAHEGKIWVESAGYDEIACPGSTFFVQLPRKQKEPQAL
jgi:signal transduction histidine kinase